ncbi:hypothetical protein LZ31DRAFT_61493 [Colletotrichum somersetense]|nr:hypothetical protein LZ31DRAFT_61493 [Colletotrichum somersetense]
MPSGQKRVRHGKAGRDLPRASRLVWEISGRSSRPEKRPGKGMRIRSQGAIAKTLTADVKDVRNVLGAMASDLAALHHCLPIPRSAELATVAWDLNNGHAHHLLWGLNKQALDSEVPAGGVESENLKDIQETTVWLGAEVIYDVGVRPLAARYLAWTRLMSRRQDYRAKLHQAGWLAG